MKGVWCELRAAATGRFSETCLVGILRSGQLVGVMCMLLRPFLLCSMEGVVAAHATAAFPAHAMEGVVVGRVRMRERAAAESTRHARWMAAKVMHVP